MLCSLLRNPCYVYFNKKKGKQILFDQAFLVKMASHWFHSFLFLDLNFPQSILPGKKKDSKNPTIFS